jgi:hypothetical protein
VGTVHFGGQLEALRFRGGTDEAAAPPAHTIAALTSGVLQHATMSPETGTPRRGRRQSMLLDVHVAIERKGKKATAYNHFFDNDFRPQFYWFRQLHFIVLLALNTLQTFLSGLPAHALYALPLYGSTMLVLVLYFVVLIWFRPMLHDESWKLPTKLGAVVVSAVGATLNLLATLNEPSFVGFAVDPDHMEMAFSCMNAIFLIAALLLVLLMTTSFVMLLLFGGDDLIPRVSRVVCVVTRWLCAITAASCCATQEEDGDAATTEMAVVPPPQQGAGITAAAHVPSPSPSPSSSRSTSDDSGSSSDDSVTEETHSADEDDEMSELADLGAFAMPAPKRSGRRSTASSFLQLAASIAAAATPTPQPASEGVAASQQTREKKKSRHALRAGIIAPAAAQQMRAEAHQHDRVDGEWLSMRDKSSGERFYHNERTGESQWHAPSRTII